MTYPVRGIILSGVNNKSMLSKGDTARFIGCEYTGSDELNCEDPNKLLIKGNTYLVNKSEVLADGYSTLHRIEVIGVEGRFNADCFERALGCIRQAQPNEG